MTNVFVYFLPSDIDKNDTQRYVRIYLLVQHWWLKINALLHWQPTERQKRQHNIDDQLKSKGQSSIDINEKHATWKRRNTNNIVLMAFLKKADNNGENTEIRIRFCQHVRPEVVCIKS